MNYNKLTLEERIEKYPPRIFECAWCKKWVVIDNSNMTAPVDKRTRFCCAHCEKQWWRKETRHPTSLTNMYKAQAINGSGREE